MKIVRNDSIRVKRYVNTNNKGIIEKSLVSSIDTKAAIMPASLSEISDVAAEVSKLELSGRRVTDYKKVFTKHEIQLHDELEIYERDYIVLKVYDYTRFGKKANHIKVVAVKIED